MSCYKCQGENKLHRGVNVFWGPSEIREGHQGEGHVSQVLKDKLVTDLAEEGDQVGERGNMACGLRGKMRPAHTGPCDPT